MGLFLFLCITRFSYSYVVQGVQVQEVSYTLVRIIIIWLTSIVQ